MSSSDIKHCPCDGPASRREICNSCRFCVSCHKARLCVPNPYCNFYRVKPQEVCTRIVRRGKYDISCCGALYRQGMCNRHFHRAYPLDDGKAWMTDRRLASMRLSQWWRSSKLWEHTRSDWLVSSATPAVKSQVPPKSRVPTFRTRKVKFPIGESSTIFEIRELPENATDAEENECADLVEDQIDELSSEMQNELATEYGGITYAAWVIAGCDHP